LYLYLDESGDLGFDFVNKKLSAFFTVCVLAIRGHDKNRALASLVRAVAKRKLNSARRRDLPELKGSATALEVKKFLYRKIQPLDFKLYAVTLNKRHLVGRLMDDKERIYNYLARMTLARVAFKDAAVRVIMTVDRSKSKQEIFDFNSYIIGQLKATLDPRVPLDIFHVTSQESPGLQAVDMFVWGIFRKYEAEDRAWFDIFREKILLEKLYLP